MAVIPIAGRTHDITLSDGTSTYGFMIRQGADVQEKVNDFAPNIALGDDPKLAEGTWRAWTQFSFTGGIDQRLFEEPTRYYYSDGDIDAKRAGKVTLNAAWASSDASKAATSPQFLDFSTNRVFVGVGTKVRRYDTSGGSWSDSSTTLATNVTFIHRHGTTAFAAVSGNNEFYTSTDLDTWSQVTTSPSTAPAVCFATWDEKLWVANNDAEIQSSTDLGVTLSTAVPVGDPGTEITNMIPAFNVLAILKEDGLYYYDNVSVVELYSFYNQKYTGNIGLVYHEGFLYFQVLDTIKKITISSGVISSMVDITPLMDGDDDKDLYGHGIPVWMWSQPDGLYVAFDNGENVYPEILVFNQLGWHQVYRGTSGDTMNAAGYSRLLGWAWLNDGASRRKKYVTLGTVAFPDYPTTGEIHTSFFDGQLRTTPKGFVSVGVFARNVTSARYITVYYRTTLSGDWTSIGRVEADNYPDSTLLPFSTSDFAVGSTAIQLKFEFTTDSSSETPVLEGFSARFINRPRTVYGFNVALEIADKQTIRDNTAETISATERRLFIDKITDSVTPILYTDKWRQRWRVYITKPSITEPHRPDILDEEQPFIVLTMIDTREGETPFEEVIATGGSITDASTKGSDNAEWGTGGAMRWNRNQWK